MHIKVPSILLGTSPFDGPPPLFISNQLQEKKYKIFNENAYIVFVTSATTSNHTGFKITWNGKFRNGYLL